MKEDAKAVPDTSEITRESLTSRIELVDKVRQLIDQLASTTADDSSLFSASEKVQEAVQLLAGLSHKQGHLRQLEGALTGLGPHGELGPFTGQLHAFAPIISIETSGDGKARKVTARASYGNAYEGAPGLLQGGFIVATFDEILGLAQAGMGRMTAQLQIYYRAPAPLHSELCYTSWVDRIEGRKAFVVGTLHCGSILCAEAQALFIAPRAKTQDGSSTNL